MSIRTERGELAGTVRNSKNQKTTGARGVTSSCGKKNTDGKSWQAVIEEEGPPRSRTETLKTRKVDQRKTKIFHVDRQKKRKRLGEENGGNPGARCPLPGKKEEVSKRRVGTEVDHDQKKGLGT